MKKGLMVQLTILIAVLGMSVSVFAQTAQGDTQIYRLYHPDLRVHLYTTDTNEYKVLGMRGWKQEGPAWLSPSKEGKSVYRLYHPDLRVHLYTTDINEYKVLATRGWRQEGVAYRSGGQLPIYRLYHEGIKKHLYTRDVNEYRILADRGWKQEGIAFYGLTTPNSSNPPVKPSSTKPSQSNPTSSTATKPSSQSRDLDVTQQPKPTTPAATTDDLATPNLESDFEWQDVSGGVEITLYKGTRKHVHIPAILGGKPVKVIGQNVFLGDVSTDTIRSVKLPESLVEIGAYAFARNPQLKSITFPSGLRKIGQGAFQSSALKSIQLPASLLEIGEDAFRENQLSQVTFPPVLREIKDGVFANNQISTLTLPAGLKIIGTYSFTRNKLQNLRVPEGVEVIASAAFSSNELSDLILPNSLKDIQPAAFDSNKLTAVSVPNQVTSIGWSAFSANSGLQLSLPEHLRTYMKKGITDNRNQITLRYLSQDGEFEFIRTDDILDESDLPTVEIINYKGNNPYIAIPTLLGGNWVTSIAEQAFLNKNMLFVDVAMTVNRIGADAFAGNPNLKLVLSDSFQGLSYSIVDDTAILEYDSIPW